MTTEQPLWLTESAIAPLAGATIAIAGGLPLLDTVLGEAVRAGMRPVGFDARPDLAVVAASDAAAHLDGAALASVGRAGLAPDEYLLARRPSGIVAVYESGAGALYAWFALVREVAQSGSLESAVPSPIRSAPAVELRMLDHWDNVAVHPTMGQVERGYAGGSIFFHDGHVRQDLSRVDRYARHLASVGINHIAINNVNVHAREARLLTDDLGEVARIADRFRPWGIRVHLSVSFASPTTLGALATSDPLDPAVSAWWADAAARVHELIPDFGGFVVKADSEGQPGPFAYGRTHADGANVLARALAPHGGLVHWRAFVYNHRQDWRDRTTDRARAAFDHFAPLDGAFDDNVIVQVKHGPIDFQPREPLSPVLFAMPSTRLAIEFQITQEYTGQQRHAVYLGTEWSELLSFRPTRDEPRLPEYARGGFAAVANIGDSPFWTGHPLARANLYAFGRLAWEPQADPIAVLDEWISLAYGTDPALRSAIHAILDRSWQSYEEHTSPLGVGFMVTPHYHYDPSVDGYEYTPWGTYHFADRDGIGVDRSRTTGTGFAGQYPEPWRSSYERAETTPDELLLFFHHVPYTHVLHSGKTVIQHIYDTHFDGLETAREAAAIWDGLHGRVDEASYLEGRERFAEQVRSATEWRDQINSYFLRKSGIPDGRGRRIY